MADTFDDMMESGKAQEYLDWYKSLNKPSIEETIEATRQSQALEEMASRAKKPMSTLGESLSGESLQKLKEAPSAQRSVVAVGEPYSTEGVMVGEPVGGSVLDPRRMKIKPQDVPVGEVLPPETNLPAVTERASTDEPPTPAEPLSGVAKTASEGVAEESLLSRLRKAYEAPLGEGPKYKAPPTRFGRLGGIGGGLLVALDAAKIGGEIADKGLHTTLKEAEEKRLEADKLLYGDSHPEVQRLLAESYVGRGKGLKPQFRTDKLLEEIKKGKEDRNLISGLVSDFEVAKGKDPYSQENPETGAYGKYQVIKKYHEDEIKNKLGASWEDFKKSPELQEKYFNDVLYPKYIAGSKDILEHPKAQELGINREQAIALQQLGKKNIIDWLDGKEFEGSLSSVPKQVEYVLGKTSKFLADKGLPPGTGTELAAMGAPREKEEPSLKEELPKKEEVSETKPEDPVSALVAKYGDQELKGRLAEIQGLKKAQESRDLTVLLNQLGKSAELIGANLGGLVERGTISKPVATEIYNQNIAQAENIVKDFKENLELQKLAKKEDPKSEESQVARSLLESLGIKIPENASAAFIEKNFASLSSLARVKEAANLRKQQQEEKTQEKKISDAEKRLDRITKTAVQGDRFLQSQKIFVDRANNITTTMNLPPLKNEKEVEAIPDEVLNQVGAKQVGEVVIELNTLLAGGMPNQTQFKKLFPETANMKFAELKDFLTSKLSPARQAAFLKFALKVAARKRGQAVANILTHQKQTFAGTERLRDILGSAYDRKISAVVGIPEDEIAEFLDSAGGGKARSKEEPLPEEKSEIKTPSKSTEKPIRLKEGVERTPGDRVSVNGVKYTVGEDGRTLKRVTGE